MAKNRKITFVEDCEELYRSIRNGFGCYSNVDGKVVFSASAFNDKDKSEPSVDRASLCGNDPNYTKFNETDGVATLITKNIRAEKVPLNDAKGKISKEYALDVVHQPLEDNYAHAAIVPNPKYSGSNHFKKVKEKLARLATEAGWKIEPTEN